MDVMSDKRLEVRVDGNVCFIRLAKPDEGNVINDALIEDFHHVLDMFENVVSVIVLEGSEDVFCLGADFQEIQRKLAKGDSSESNPENLYCLWERLAFGPYISISHVKGRANAGGVGFVAASDIVISDQKAEFSLSELLFGLLPACVMPFLVRRVGPQKASYLSLSTLPVSADEARLMGLVDICGDQTDLVLRKKLARLRRLSKEAISRQKLLTGKLERITVDAKSDAIAANREVFSDPRNLNAIRRYVESGLFPWE